MTAGITMRAPDSALSSGWLISDLYADELTEFATREQAEAYAAEKYQITRWGLFEGTYFDAGTADALRAEVLIVRGK